jgi:phosphoribosylanthranilate isomerase
MSIKVKICGITNYEDAKVAVSVGADALGFIFYQKSPRYITPHQAKDIIKRLPPFVSRVGVFVNEDRETIMSVAGQSCIDTVQLHGDESPSLCDEIPFAVIKTFSVGQDFNGETLDSYNVNGYLLDTWNDKLRGGSGKTFDWSIARIITQYRHNIILAGGLGPANIAEALDAVQPYAVEFNSGVEIKPGVKNPRKMKDAVAVVKSWKI